MDKYKSLLGNTVIFTISRIGTKLIVFFLVPLYTAYLTAAELGTAELIVTTVDIAIPILTLGIKNAVFRFAFDKDTEPKDVLKCFYLVFAAAGIMAAIISILLLPFDTVSIYGKWLFPLSMLTVFNETYGLFLKARNKTLIFAIDGIVYVLFLALFNIIFLKYLHLGVTGYLLAIVVAKVISILYMFVFGKEIKVAAPTNVNKELLSEMIKYAFPLIASTLAWWAISYADRYMLGIQVGMTVVGVYTIASKIPSMVTTFNMIVMDAWSISFIGEYEKEDNGKNEEFFRKVFEGYNVIIVMLTSGILLILRPFMHVYVSKGYYGSIEVIPMLLFGALFLSYASFLGAVFSAEKKSSIIMTSSIISGCWNIAVNFILIPKFEMFGAAFATMTAYMIMTLHRYLKAKQYVKISIKWEDAANIILLIVQIIAVTINWHQYIISAAVIVLLLAINYKSIKKTVYKISGIARAYLKKGKR